MASKRRSGRFVKPRIRKQKARPSDVLADMRAVYGQGESQDRGPAQKALRQMFVEDMDGFLARLERLEQSYQAESQTENVVEKEPVEPDYETARTVVLKLLDKFHEKQAQKTAELVKRSDSAMICVTLEKDLAGSLERQAMMQKEIDDLRRRA